jgi:hypothetical protein
MVKGISRIQAALNLITNLIFYLLLSFTNILILRTNYTDRATTACRRS